MVKRSVRGESLRLGRLKGPDGGSGSLAVDIELCGSPFCIDAFSIYGLPYFSTAISFVLSDKSAILFSKATSLVLNFTSPLIAGFFFLSALSFGRFVERRPCLSLALSGSLGLIDSESLSIFRKGASD